MPKARRCQEGDARCIPLLTIYTYGTYSVKVDLIYGDYMKYAPERNVATSKTAVVE